MNNLNGLIKELSNINNIQRVENIIDNNNFFMYEKLEVYTYINKNNKHVFDKIFKINQEKRSNLISFDSCYFLKDFELICKYNFGIDGVKSNKNNKEFDKFLDYGFLFYKLNLNYVLYDFNINAQKTNRTDEFVYFYSSFLLNKNNKNISNIEILYKNIKKDFFENKFNNLKYPDIFLDIIEKSTLKALEKENIFDYNHPNSIAIYIENIVYQLNNTKLDSLFLKNFYEIMSTFHNKIQKDVIMDEIKESIDDNTNFKNKRKM